MIPTDIDKQLLLGDLPSTRAQFFGEAGKLIPRPMSIKEELTDQTVYQPEWFVDWMACTLNCRLSSVQSKAHAV